MAKLQRHCINVVALGRQNPQILTADWLKANEIVPVDKQPFKELFAQNKPFSKFVSTPVFTNLVLGPIEFVVDQERFQISETAIEEWNETKIIQICVKYFEVLCHTPLRIAGTNMTAKLRFSDPEEDRRFQELFIPMAARVFKTLDSKSVNANTILRYPYPSNDGRVTLSIGESHKEKNERLINFNYEFDFTDWAKFQTKLADIPKVGEYCDSILTKLIGSLKND